MLSKCTHIPKPLPMSTVGRVRAKDFVEGITVLACHNCHNYAHARGLKKTKQKQKKTGLVLWGHNVQKICNLSRFWL